MKNLIIIFSALVLFSCKSKTSENNSVEETLNTTIIEDNNFDWLIGNWHRTNGEENTETYETWKKINDATYQGLGFSLQNKDTVFLEVLKLINHDSIWNFEVALRSEKNPTIFKLTKIDEEKFIAENSQNEFPKKIEYYQDGEYLKANVSSPEMEILFEFERIDYLPK